MTPDADQASAGRWGRRTEGLLAGALMLSVIWAASRLDASIPFAPSSVGGAIIRLTPGDVATFMIETLGHAAQTLLSAGVVLAYLLIASLLPERTTRAQQFRPGSAGLVMFFALAVPLLLAPLAPTVAVGIVTSALGAGLYALSIDRLARLDPIGADADLARRRALWTVGSAAAGLAVGGTVLGRLTAPSAPSDVTLAKAARPARIPARGPFPTIGGLAPEVTPVADHYVVDINLVRPAVELSGWSLELSGEVDRPLTLDFAQLQGGFPIVEQYSVLTCISNEVGGPLIGNSKWTGVRLADVLDEVGVGPDTVDLKLSCADGYSVGIPIAQAREPTAILAFAQDGKPLTTDHGFPCRLRAPALYGMLNAKWLERIEAVPYNYTGYWADRGWLDVAFVRTQSRIDVAGPVVAIGARTWIAGVAWAGDRGIAAVEVSTDAGESWSPAQLREPISPVAWTQWAYAWTADRRGTQEILCRATDGRGEVQDARITPPHPSGATGYPVVRVEVN